MLVGQLEASGIGCELASGASGFEGKAVERRKHREFELDRVAAYRGESLPVIPRVFRELNLVCLRTLAVCSRSIDTKILTTSFFTL